MMSIIVCMRGVLTRDENVSKRSRRRTQYCEPSRLRCTLSASALPTAAGNALQIIRGNLETSSGSWAYRGLETQHTVIPKHVIGNRTTRSSNKREELNITTNHNKRNALQARETRTHTHRTEAKQTQAKHTTKKQKQALQQKGTVQANHRK